MAERALIREAMIRRSLRASHIRTRERNIGEKLTLDSKVRQLEKTLQRRRRKVDKEIDQVKTMLDKYHDNSSGSSDESDNDESNTAIRTPYHSLPCTPSSALRAGRDNSKMSSASAKSHVTFGRTSVQTINSEMLQYPETAELKSRQRKNRTCRFDSKTGECAHFPCTIPKHYNTLGYQIIPHQMLPLLTNSNSKSADLIRTDIIKTTAKARKALKKVVEDCELESVRRPLRCKIDQTDLKTEGLTKAMDHLRYQSIIQRPLGREAKYGEPFPRKQVLKAARAVRSDF
ncbi:unnamed protein product [Owenia fusiformis]|uniref:Uncharacterized protein n=1 Tax=Owenia fusiformis TaxID=6347 RepID=A0A8S4PG56_OWEFU|nr:unnamed protein product [Owenia fusiformis]